MYNPNNFVMPKKTNYQVTEDWLASYGYRWRVQITEEGKINELVPLPIGDIGNGQFCPCSVNEYYRSEPGESLKDLITRVHPEWLTTRDNFR